VQQSSVEAEEATRRWRADPQTTLVFTQDDSGTSTIGDKGVQRKIKHVAIARVSLDALLKYLLLIHVSVKLMTAPLGHRPPLHVARVVRQALEDR
jgi:hypothetical protein